MNKQKFSGMRIVIGSAIYMLMIMSVLGLYGPLYGKLTEHFHTNLVGLSIAISMCQILGAVTGMFAGKMLRTFKPRKMMFLGGIIALIFGASMCFLTFSVIGFCIAMGIAGVACGFCAHGCVTDLIMRWYIEKRSVMISIIMAIAMFGTAVGQTLSGILYGAGLSIGYIFLVGSIILAVPILLVSIFMIRDDPAELGQVPLGAVTNPEPMVEQQEESKGKAAETVDFGKELYRNPVFWMLAVAICFTNSGASYIAGYLNTFLPNLNPDYFSTGAAFMAVMGYTAAIVMLLSGKIIEKIGIRNFTFLAMSGCFIGNGLLLFLSYDQSSMFAVLCGVTVGYSFGYACSTIQNLLCPILFANSDVVATEANTKLIALMYGSSAILGPTLSGAIEAAGFRMFYILCLIFNVITLLSFILAFFFAKKRGMKI